MVWGKVQCHCFACRYPIFPVPFVEKDCPSPLNGLGACRKSFDRKQEDLFLSAPFFSNVCMSVFLPVPHYFDYCSFVISFEIRKGEDSSFCSSFRDCFAYSGSLRFHMSFRIDFLFLKKRTENKRCWDFDKNYTKSVDCFGSY